MSDKPIYEQVTYYALFERHGWHAIRTWGEYQDIRVECGPVYSLWDGERVLQVVSKAPDGLCGGCLAAVTQQAVFDV